MEIAAFTVSPSHQGMGLGIRVLSEMEWLAIRAGGSGSSGIGGSSRLANAPAFEEACLPSTPSGPWSQIDGIDFVKLEQSYRQGSKGFDTLTEAALHAGVYSKKLKLVLVGIRELGNEAYYERRGYTSVWAGVVPVGMWDRLEERTMVYMEKELLS